MNKTKGLLLAAGISLAMAFTGCASNKNANAQIDTAQEAQKQEAFDPLAGATLLPCADFDTDEYFVGWGAANGSYKRLDVLNSSVLANAQQIVRQKMQHSYKGMIRNYMDAIGTNQGTDAAMHLEQGGDQIIDKVINDTRAHCGPMATKPDADGHITLYMSIRIYKQQLASNIASSIANKVSEEEKLKIRFNEQEFGKKMEEAFKNYKEGN